MNNLKATKRETATAGQLNKLRESGFIPAILYGGQDSNAKISIEKKLIKNILNSDSFLSSVLELDVDGNKLKVIPREVAYNVISDEPIHIDFMRVVAGAKIVLDIPVKFINNDDCPGLKVGGV
jgi:large subunit ribosomal protein L25